MENENVVHFPFSFRLAKGVYKNLVCSWTPTAVGVSIFNY